MKYYKNSLILCIRTGTYFKLNRVNFDFMLTLTTRLSTEEKTKQQMQSPLITLTALM